MVVGSTNSLAVLILSEATQPHLLLRFCWRQQNSSQWCQRPFCMNLTNSKDVTQFNSLRFKNPSIWFSEIIQHMMLVGQSVADGKINPNIVGLTDSAYMVARSVRSDE